LHYLFRDLHISLDPTIVYFDNRYTIYPAHNLVFRECTMHIEIDYHVNREKIQQG